MDKLTQLQGAVEASLVRTKLEASVLGQIQNFRSNLDELGAVVDLVSADGGIFDLRVALPDLSADTFEAVEVTGAVVGAMHRIEGEQATVDDDAPPQAASGEDPEFITGRWSERELTRTHSMSRATLAKLSRDPSFHKMPLHFRRGHWRQAQQHFDNVVWLDEVSAPRSPGWHIRIAEKWVGHPAFGIKKSYHAPQMAGAI